MLLSADRVELTFHRPRPELQEAMWVIYRDFFRNNRPAFLECMRNRTHFALYFSGDQLIGYTGLNLDLDKVAGHKVFLVHFGRTLLLPDYAHHRLLTRLVLKLLWRYRKVWLRYPSYAWRVSGPNAQPSLFPPHGNNATVRAGIPPPAAAALREHLWHKYAGASVSGSAATADLQFVALNRQNIFGVVRRAILQFFYQPPPPVESIPLPLSADSQPWE